MFQQLISIFHNLTSDKNFIITGIFYILILNILPFIKILDLLIFFAIYGCYKHLKSKPKLNKDRLLMSLSIIIILILEVLNLFNYIISKIIFEFEGKNMKYSMLISFFLFISYLTYISMRTNPNKTAKIFKAFLINFFQLFAVLICYIFVIKSFMVEHIFEPIVILIVISMLILASCNILTKKSSLILEIICFAHLFFVFMSTYSISSREINDMQLSFKNNIAIFIIFIDIIGLALIFLKNKNYPEKAKIFLIILLTISLFISNNSIFYFHYYLTSSIFLPILIIYYKKLSISHTKIFFIILNLIMFVASMALTSGRGGGLGSSLMGFTLLNLIILFIIIFFSNQIEGKNKIQNNTLN